MNKLLSVLLFGLLSANEVDQTTDEETRSVTSLQRVKNFASKYKWPIVAVLGLSIICAYASLRSDNNESREKTAARYDELGNGTLSHYATNEVDRSSNGSAPTPSSRNPPQILLDIQHHLDTSPFEDVCLIDRSSDKILIPQTNRRTLNANSIETYSIDALINFLRTLYVLLSSYLESVKLCAQAEFNGNILYLSCSNTAIVKVYTNVKGTVYQRPGNVSDKYYQYGQSFSNALHTHEMLLENPAYNNKQRRLSNTGLLDYMLTNNLLIIRTESLSDQDDY